MAFPVHAGSGPKSDTAPPLKGKDPPETKADAEKRSGTGQGDRQEGGGAPMGMVWA